MEILHKFNIKSDVKSIDSEANKGIVSIYVSAFNKKDNVGDIVTPTAFNKTVKENYKNILHLLNHDWNKFIGMPIDFKSDNVGLLVTSALNLDTDLARQTFSNYKFAQSMERTLKHSFGYEVIKEEFDNEKQANILKEIKLYEYSTLTRPPANDNTPLVSLKANTDLSELYNKLEKLYNVEEITSRLKNLENCLNNISQNFNQIFETMEAEKAHSSIDNIELTKNEESAKSISELEILQTLLNKL